MLVLQRMNLGGKFILIGVRIRHSIVFPLFHVHGKLTLCSADLSKIHWGALAQTLPTQFALLFFNVRECTAIVCLSLAHRSLVIVHPPLNVPALGTLP